MYAAGNVPSVIYFCTALLVLLLIQSFSKYNSYSLLKGQVHIFFPKSVLKQYSGTQMSIEMCFFAGIIPSTHADN